MSDNKKTPWWVTHSEDVGGSAVGIGLIIAFVIVASQCYQWLQEGYWNAIPILTLFSTADFVTDYSSWYYYPDSWVGVNTVLTWILEKIPLSIAVVGAGYFFKVINEVSVDEYWEKNRKE